MIATGHLHLFLVYYMATLALQKAGGRVRVVTGLTDSLSCERKSGDLSL